MTMNTSGFLLQIWHYLRFVLAGTIMFFLLGALYLFSRDEWHAGSIIALLSWLYMTAVILIMGAEINAALNEV